MRILIRLEDHFLANNFLSMLNTILANVSFLTGNQDLYLITASAAEGTMKSLLFCHGYFVNPESYRDDVQIFANLKKCPEIRALK